MENLQINRFVLLAFPALLAGASAAQSGRANDNDAELTRAREDIKKTQAIVAAAEQKIVASYQEFERFIAAAKSDPTAPKIEAAARKAIDLVRADIASGTLTSDPAQRGKITNEIRRRAVEEFTTILPESLRGPAAGKLSPNLYNATLAAADPTEVIHKLTLDMCSKWFDPSAPVHELWNRDLFKEVGAAREYADARGALAAANEKLARLEHPERFHPAYANTPEGMVFIIGGQYTVGPNDGYDIDANRRKTAAQITVKPFYIDKTEVTNKQYYDFLKAAPRAEAKIRLPQGWQFAKDGNAVIPAGKDTFPVTGICYEDAAAYATWAKKRLPTEDEWEVAARGAKGYLYPWGASYESHRANDQNADSGGAAPVGAFPGDESPFGAFDMSGNVMEWTGTLAGGKPAPPKLDGNVDIVLRGGAYDRDPKKCSAVYRWVYASTTKVGNLGFRCAKDAFQ